MESWPENQPEQQIRRCNGGRRSESEAREPNAECRRQSRRKSPKFAGFENGKTNEAAFATKAQAYRYGSGSTPEDDKAAKTAGVRTSAVVSLESRAVTHAAAAKTSKKRRLRDVPAAARARTARAAKTPPDRAISARIAMPARNAKTLAPPAIVDHAAAAGSARSNTTPIRAARSPIPFAGAPRAQQHAGHNEHRNSHDRQRSDHAGMIPAQPYSHQANIHKH